MCTCVCVYLCLLIVYALAQFESHVKLYELILFVGMVQEKMANKRPRFTARSMCAPPQHDETEPPVPSTKSMQNPTPQISTPHPQNQIFPTAPCPSNNSTTNIPYSTQMGPTAPPEFEVPPTTPPHVADSSPQVGSNSHQSGAMNTGGSGKVAPRIAACDEHRNTC